MSDQPDEYNRCPACSLWTTAPQCCDNTATLPYPAMTVRGTTHRGDAVEFPAYFCTCPMEQEPWCGHWCVNHESGCELEYECGAETVRSCSGGWFGSRGYLNEPGYRDWPLRALPASARRKEEPRS